MTRDKEGMPLTDRQREIVNLVSQDLDNVDIAERLRLSVKTVEHHKHHIQSRLGLTHNQLWAKGARAALIEAGIGPTLDALDEHVLSLMASALFSTADQPTRSAMSFKDLLAMDLYHALEVIQKLETCGYIEPTEETKGAANTQYIITASGWQRAYPIMLERAKRASL